MHCGCITGSSVSEDISRLFLADEQCLLTCSRTSGTLTVWDFRAGLVVYELPRVVQTMDSCSLSQSAMAWTCDQLSHNRPVTTLVLLASDGHVSVVDVRSGCQNHDLLSLSTGQKFSHASHDYMTVRVSSSYVRIFGGYYVAVTIGGCIMDCTVSVLYHFFHGLKGLESSRLTGT